MGKPFRMIIFKCLAIIYFAPLSEQLLTECSEFQNLETPWGTPLSAQILFSFKSRYQNLKMSPVNRRTESIRPPANLQPYHWIRDASTTHPYKWMNKYSECAKKKEQQCRCMHNRINRLIQSKITSERPAKPTKRQNPDLPRVSERSTVIRIAEWLLSERTNKN